MDWDWPRSLGLKGPFAAEDEEDGVVVGVLREEVVQVVVVVGVVDEEAAVAAPLALPARTFVPRRSLLFQGRGCPITCGDPGGRRWGCWASRAARRSAAPARAALVSHDAAAPLAAVPAVGR